MSPILTGELFQSTLPARGATAIIEGVSVEGEISIHTPREGSDLPHLFAYKCHNNFNPHSPRGERHGEDRRELWVDAFQSTLPARGATAKVDMTMEHYLLKIDKMLKNIEL